MPAGESREMVEAHSLTLPVSPEGLLRTWFVEGPQSAEKLWKSLTNVLLVRQSLNGAAPYYQARPLHLRFCAK
jgi:hypothetical protein